MKTKEEILDGWDRKNTLNKLQKDLILMAMDEYAKEAIADHEQGKWKKYPDEKPDGDDFKTYLIQNHNKSIYVLAAWLFVTHNVIAWQELPAPYELKDEWSGGKVKCDVCNHEWIAVRLSDTQKLECPNCGNMVNYEPKDE